MRFKKKYQRGIFLLFLLLIIISGITLVKNIPKNNLIDENDILMSQADDLFERNNDFDSAKDINSEKLKWLKLIQEDDDWFKFDISPGFERVIIKVLFSNAYDDINFELYDESYSYITGSYSGSMGEFLDYIVPFPGTYRLYIYGWNNGNPYTLLWDALNSSIAYDDNYEPNNNDIEADNNADFSSNKGEWLSSIRGLGVQKDLDYFKINVDPTYRRLFVEVIFSHFFGNIDVDIYNSTLGWVTGSYSFNHNEFINFELNSSGIYYIVVYGSNASNTYDLRWNTGPVEDNYETNNDRFQATDLTSYKDRQLSLINGPGIQREDDWYKISVNSTEKRLRVDVKFRYAFGDIDIEIYDEWGGWITDSWSNRNGELIDYVLPSGGIYYILIRGDNNGNIYDFFWEHLSTDDRMENNDDFDSAWPIEPKYYPDLKIVEYDEDWFKIDLNPEDIIDIDIYFNNFDGDLQLELYDPSDPYSPQQISDSYESNNKHISFDADESGEWRIRVYRVSGDSNIDVIYHLEIWINGMQAGDDPYEYNNWLDEAYFLSDDEDTWLSDIHGLAVQGDEDWYMIDVTPGFEQLMVNLSITNGFGNIWFTIYNEWGNYIDDSYPTPYGEHFDSTISPGIYFIKVYGDYFGIEYDLWWDDIRTVFSEDAYEENDNFINATDLSFREGQELEHYLGFGVQYDQDWFEIFVTPEELILNVILYYDSAEGLMGFEVYDDSLKKIIGNFTMEDNDFILYRLRSNGTYYIKVFGDNTGNVYNMLWKTKEYIPIEDIPGYDILILLGSIFGVASIVVLKLKRSKFNRK